MKKFAALLLIAVTILTLSACGSKDALAGTWSAEFEYDGTITWTFDGKGKCTMENSFMKQDGTYSIDGDQLTVNRLRHQRHIHEKIGDWSSTDGHISAK